MSYAFFISQGTGLAALPRHFPLTLGGRLDGAVLAYELRGPEGAPVVALLGGLSAGRHAASSEDDPEPGWFEKPLERLRARSGAPFRWLSIDYLGGAGASSGPVSTELGEGFPQVTTADQARALASLLDFLGIEELALAAGGSFGGLVALAFAVRNPKRVRQVLTLGAAHATHPAATALRSIQRKILTLGAAAGDGGRGVALARELALVAYRSAEEFQDRFAVSPIASAPPRFPVEEFLEARGEAFARRFDAASYRILSTAIDLHRIDPRDLRVPLTAVAFSTDGLVPPWLVAELVRGARGPARLRVVESLRGHDAFLVEADAVAEILTEALHEACDATTAGGQS